MNPQPAHLDMLACAITGEACRITAESDVDWYFRTIEAHGLARSDDGWRVGFPAEMFPTYAMPKVELITQPLGTAAMRGT